MPRFRMRCAEPIEDSGTALPRHTPLGGLPEDQDFNPRGKPITPRRRYLNPTIGLSLKFGPRRIAKEPFYFAAPERVVGFRLGCLPCVLASHVLVFVHFSSPGLGGFASGGFASRSGTGA